jgi:hypothetical protein
LNLRAEAAQRPTSHRVSLNVTPATKEAARRAAGALAVPAELGYHFPHDET